MPISFQAYATMAHRAFAEEFCAHTPRFGPEGMAQHVRAKQVFVDGRARLRIEVKSPDFAPPGETSSRLVYVDYLPQPPGLLFERAECFVRSAIQRAKATAALRREPEEKRGGPIRDKPQRARHPAVHVEHSSLG